MSDVFIPAETIFKDDEINEEENFKPYQEIISKNRQLLFDAIPFDAITQGGNVTSWMVDLKVPRDNQLHIFTCVVLLSPPTGDPKETLTFNFLNQHLAAIEIDKITELIGDGKDYKISATYLTADEYYEP